MSQDLLHAFATLRRTFQGEMLDLPTVVMDKRTFDTVSAKILGDNCHVKVDEVSQSSIAGVPIRVEGV